ncbi:hypothetical protein Mro03_79860 [Microbispora rosea subsp. rosea]|nr:hypothetical protein Mro03_79860 [Microbispora rosea subsp. rosea]
MITRTVLRSAVATHSHSGLRFIPPGSDAVGGVPSACRDRESPVTVLSKRSLRLRTMATAVMTREITSRRNQAPEMEP